MARHNEAPSSVMENFKPFSLTSLLRRVVEKLILALASQNLAEHSLFCPARHGFVKGGYCITDLLCFLDEVTCRLDEGTQI